MIAFIFFVAGIVALVLSNWWRARSPEQVRLIPNCLITRSPIVFVAGIKSPFYFLKYWNHIPYILREHGYEVMELDLPWRRPNERKQGLSVFLEASKKESLCFHFIFDLTVADEAQWLKSWNHPAIQSVNITAPAYSLQAVFGIHTWSFQSFCNRLAVTFHRFYVRQASTEPTFKVTSDAPVRDFLRLAVALAEDEINQKEIAEKVPILAHTESDEFHR